MRNGAGILGMVVALAMAWAFDRLLEGARNMAQAPVSVPVYQWLVLLPAPPFWTLGQGVPGGTFPILQASPFSFFGKASAFLAVMGAVGMVAGRRGAVWITKPRRLEEEREARRREDSEALGDGAGRDGEA